MLVLLLTVFFFFNDTATTEIYTLSLHDALPICERDRLRQRPARDRRLQLHLRRRHDHSPSGRPRPPGHRNRTIVARSEEHTSELQSQSNLVCRLLLEKKKKCI